MQCLAGDYQVWTWKNVQVDWTWKKIPGWIILQVKINSPIVFSWIYQPKVSGDTTQPFPIYSTRPASRFSRLVCFTHQSIGWARNTQEQTINYCTLSLQTVLAWRCFKNFWKIKLQHYLLLREFQKKLYIEDFLQFKFISLALLLSWQTGKLWMVSFTL